MKDIKALVDKHRKIWYVLYDTDKVAKGKEYRIGFVVAQDDTIVRIDKEIGELQTESKLFKIDSRAPDTLTVIRGVDINIIERNIAQALYPDEDWHTALTLRKL